MDRGIAIVTVAIGADARCGRILSYACWRAVAIEIVIGTVGRIVDESVTVFVSRNGFGIIAWCAQLGCTGEDERIGVIAVGGATDVTIGGEPIPVLIARTIATVAILIDSIAADFLRSRMNHRDIVVAIARAAWITRGAGAPAISVSIFAFGIASVAVLIDAVTTELWRAWKDRGIAVVAVFALTAHARVVTSNGGSGGTWITARGPRIRRKRISICVEVAAQRTDEEHLVERDTSHVVASDCNEVFARVAPDRDDVDHGPHGSRQRDRDSDRFARFDVSHGSSDWARTRTTRRVGSREINDRDLNRLDVALTARFEQNRVLCWSACTCRKKKRRQERNGVTD
jgi:hypothetical protein